MHHPGTTETRRMLDTVCKPAVQAVADELIKQGMNVDVQQTPLEDEEALYHLDITIHLKKSKNFVYQIWPVRYSAPNFSQRKNEGNSSITVSKPIFMKVLKTTTLLVTVKNRLLMTF